MSPARFPARGARSWRRVSPLSLGVLGLALAGQLAWHGRLPPPVARPDALPPALELASLRVLSGGDPVLGAKVLMLWLLGFDQQPGVSLPYRSLDYARVRDWLARALELDPRSQYPLLAASRLYGEVADPARSRMMLDFVDASFDADPARRWPWLAHAVFLAQHRLRDPERALRYARRLADAPGAGIPGWARQLQIFVLENIGELEAARILLGGLLDSGQLTDPHERAFLARRLDDIAARLGDVEKSTDLSD